MYSVIPHIKIAGIAAAVPQTEELITESDYGTLEDREKFAQYTGIKKRRMARQDQCASDLAFEAAKKLLDDLSWKRDEIDILIFVTHTPDYYSPATSIVLQNRLGISQSCLAFDINLGCSGYVIGLQTMVSMMVGLKGKKGLLLVGDTSTRHTFPVPRGDRPPIFGDAGSATALEWDNNAPDMFFEAGCDGSGSHYMIREMGMFRNPLTHEILTQLQNGNPNRSFIEKLDGHAVFNFSTSKVPRLVKDLLVKSGVEFDSINYFIFHQANKVLNECIRKSLRIDEEKHPYSLHQYGNTTSVTIPITIVSQLREALTKNKTTRLLISGFGVGLSWGTGIITLNDVCIPELIEVA